MKEIATFVFINIIGSASLLNTFANAALIGLGEGERIDPVVQALFPVIAVIGISYSMWAGFKLGKRHIDKHTGSN